MATITQKVIFKNTTVQQLYALYMDPKLHGHITNSKVKISEKAGSALNVFDGYIFGKTLLALPNSLIVQQWSGADWAADAEPSAFVLSFEQKGNDAILHVHHANVPDEKAAGLDKGWHDHYWNPWKQHLQGKTITRPNE